MCVWVKITPAGPQVLVLGSTYRSGKPFWGYPILTHSHVHSRLARKLPEGHWKCTQVFRGPESFHVRLGESHLPWLILIQLRNMWRNPNCSSKFHESLADLCACLRYFGKFGFRPIEMFPRIQFKAFFGKRRVFLGLIPLDGPGGPCVLVCVFVFKRMCFDFQGGWFVLLFFVGLCGFWWLLIHTQWLPERN